MQSWTTERVRGNAGPVGLPYRRVVNQTTDVRDGVASPHGGWQAQAAMNGVGYVNPDASDFGTGPGFDTALRYHRVDGRRRPGVVGGWGPVPEKQNTPRTVPYPLDRFVNHPTCRGRERPIAAPKAECVRVAPENVVPGSMLALSSCPAAGRCPAP
jgi:hypothetical protein